MRHPSLVVAAFAVIVFATPASAKILITVDKSTQEMTVAVDGVTKWVWPVSTGRGLSYDTPSGTHKAFRMEKDHFSKEWDDAPMPYSIFFTKVGHAIHGSYDIKRLGTPASHGCVRLLPANAAKLFDLVQQQGVTNATVVLTGDVRVAMARAGSRTAAAAPAGTTAQPLALQPDAAAAQARYEPQDGYRQPQYGYQQPQQYGYQQQPVYQSQPTFPQPFRPLFPFFR